ncbi:MAG: phosphate ABC transporter substrate-binding protein [Clostridiales bacterium]|nr:phosphate ABC transporter substrate-binding protein [Clostridiales bacterium]
MKMKKILSLTVAGILALSLSACGAKDNTLISVISREEGSGTRGAFVELTGVEEKADDGTKADKTTEEAIIQSSTDAVLTQVSGNKNAIGYISLGSVNDKVKAVKIDGVEATVDNIKADKYSLARPFNIATKENVSDVSQDFINYIMSAEGQKIVTDNKYIAVKDNAEAFSTNGAKGKIVVSGSSSVTPVMEKLSEAYRVINKDAEIEVQQSDSSTGMKDAISGSCDIGMASRELKDTEKAELIPTVIALDGIAVIVNKDNEVSDLSLSQVKKIYTAEVEDWADFN